MSKPLLVVLSGAGMSAESGLKTFRDSGGLWEGYRIADVATFEAWLANPNMVLDFYNQRRRQLAQVEPHEGHRILAKLENKFDVQVITQNVDDLHERASSSNLLHLHGELVYAKGTKSPFHRVFIKYDDINPGDLCPSGSQLRPDIVWFGEPVTKIQQAAEICSKADILIVVGTSLEVYPAAGLIDFAGNSTRIFIIDPKRHVNRFSNDFTIISKGAKDGLTELADSLYELY